MRKWKFISNPHTAYMSDDHYFGKWSPRSDTYNLYEPVKGDLVCMVFRKKLVNYCNDNDLSIYTYLLYIFERCIDKYNKRYSHG